MESPERSKQSHKRKAAALENGQDAASSSSPNLKITISDPSSSLGPVFANFPSIRPSKDTPFILYSRDPTSSTNIARQSTVLAGETEDVDFFSTNRAQGSSTESSECQYLPAIYDPDAGTLRIHPSAPLYLLVHRAKRMRNLEAQVEKSDDYRARRNNLGEVFGTRKAKSQIRAEERNKLNAEAMEGVRGHLMETIGAKQEESEVALPSELIPPPNTSTEDASQVYPRESLISDTEWSSIDASTILKQKDDRGRALLLPYRKSRIIENKMREISGASLSSSIKKSSIRMCFLLACLLSINDRSNDIARATATELPAKFSTIPGPLFKGLLDRFTEHVGGKRKVTDKLQTKLLAWICVAYLHIADFKADITGIAKELSMQPTKIITLYKSLGCRIDIPSPEEREQLGVSLDGAKAMRKAVLKAPVKFPKPKTRVPTRNRR